MVCLTDLYGVNKQSLYTFASSILDDRDYVETRADPVQQRNGGVA